MRECEFSTEHAEPVPAEVIKLGASYTYGENGAEYLAPTPIYACRSCVEYFYDGTEEFPGHVELPEDEL